MKKLFLMLSLAGAITCAFAQAPAAVTPAADPNAPEIKWESMTIDYGTVNKGDENNATREFKLTNTGKQPLIITDCHGSCGCTVPTCPKDPVQPGAKAAIKVHYDINRVGPFTKTVTVNSNAKTPSETLKIQGTVKDVPAPPSGAPAVTPNNTTTPH